MTVSFSGQWCRKTRERLERILTQNIMPFWYPASIDGEKGGYYLNHDIHDKPMGEGTKMIVTQGRMVWFFSKAFNTRWRGTEFLEAAEHGYHFLRDRMWDTGNGGFLWEVDWEGNPLRLSKHMYGQAFGLYALSEFAMASKDEEALGLARRLFNLMEKHSHDDQHGGYREYFLRDWSDAPVDEQGYLGSIPEVKLMNTHLHMLEALITYYKASKDPVARERLNEMIFVLSNSVVRKTIGACAEEFHSDWTPLHGPEHGRVSYGHDLENVWLLMHASRTVGIPDSLLSDLYRTLFSYSSRFGFDTQEGGLYESGPLNQPADRLDKVWWIQAEALVSEIYMYHLTRDPLYLGYFEKTLDWIENHLVDWKNGDWFNTIRPDGKPVGNKADIWKSAYHNSRAMIEALAKLKQLG